MGRAGRLSRSLVITPLGHRILRAVAKGTYRFDKRGQPTGHPRRGRKMRRGK